MKPITALSIASLVVAPLAVHAVPTVLINVPIADVLAKRSVYFEHSFIGFERSFQKHYSHLGGVTVGVYDNVEFGAATDYNGNGFFRGKANVWRQKDASLSLGFTNASGKRVDPYLVGRYDQGPLRWHAGWARFNNVSTGYLGADYAWKHGIAFQAEHIGGSLGSTSFAASYTHSSGLFLQVAYGFANDRDTTDTHFALVGYTLKF